VPPVEETKEVEDHTGTPPDTVSKSPAVPIVRLEITPVAEAYNISPTAYDVILVPPFTTGTVLKVITLPVMTIGVVAVNAEGTVDHVLSPLRNVVESFVPDADKSTVPMLTEPVAAAFVVTFTNVPAVDVKAVTPPPKELIVTAPVPPTGEIVTFVPATIDVTPSAPSSSILLIEALLVILSVLSIISTSSANSGGVFTGYV
tara:strand:- start:63 stop:668 length:606 start_codon:yes stop_codon:yes gene_type:complete